MKPTTTTVTFVFFAITLLFSFSSGESDESHPSPFQVPRGEHGATWRPRQFHSSPSTSPRPYSKIPKSTRNIFTKYAPTDIILEGPHEKNWTPADPVLAVSPNRMVVCVNGELQLLDKASGTFGILDSQDPACVFTNCASTPYTYDPRVIYHLPSERFVVVYLTGASTDRGRSTLQLLSLDKDADSFSQGILHSIDADQETPANGFGVDLWADYPTIGYDHNNLYIGLNMYLINTNNGPIHAKLYLIPIDEIHSSSGNPDAEKKEFLRFQLGDPGPNDLAFTIMPTVRRFTTGSDHIHVGRADYDKDLFTFYTTVNANDPSAYTIGSGDNLSPNDEPPVVDIVLCDYNNNYTPFSKSPQPGTDDRLDSGDGRIQSVAYHEGLNLLYIATIVEDTNGTVTTSAVQVNGFNTSTYPPTCIDVGNGTHIITGNSKTNEEEALWFSYPTMVFTDDGTLVVAFTATSSYLSGTGYMAMKPYLEPWTEPMRIHDTDTEAEAALAPLGAGNSARFGDYSDIVLDPENPNRVWAITGYVAPTKEYNSNRGAWSSKIWSMDVSITTAPEAQCGGTCGLYTPCISGTCPCEEGRQFEGFYCYTAACAEFRNCAGRGTCDFLEEVCVCESPWSGDSCRSLFSTTTLLIVIGSLLGCVALGIVYSRRQEAKKPPLYPGPGRNLFSPPPGYHRPPPTTPPPHLESFMFPSVNEIDGKSESSGTSSPQSPSM